MPELRVFLRGDIDIAAAPSVRAELAEAVAAADGDVIVDCREVTFMDSTGVALLMAAHTTLGASGGRLRVVNAGPATRRVLELLGLIETLDVGDEPHRAAS